MAHGLLLLSDLLQSPLRSNPLKRGTFILPKLYFGCPPGVVLHTQKDHQKDMRCFLYNTEVYLTFTAGLGALYPGGVCPCVLCDVDVARRGGVWHVVLVLDTLVVLLQQQLTTTHRIQ